MKIFPHAAGIRRFGSTLGLAVAIGWATLAMRTEAAVPIVTWKNSGTDFETGTNWNGNVTPVTTDIASFGTAATHHPTLAADWGVNGVRFANGAGAFTFSGSGGAILSLGASGIEQLDNSTQIIAASLALKLDAAASFTVGSTGALTIASAVDNNGNLLTLTSASSGAGSISGAISGAGGLTKSGTNTWTLSGANAYTGVTTVNTGILVTTTMADGGANSGIGAATNDAANLVLNGGTLRFTGTSAQSSNRLFTLGTPGATLDATGTAGSALNLTNTGNMAFNGSGNRTLTLTGTNTSANTLAAAIGDSGGATALTKTGTGVWVIAGDNNFTGATTLTAGTLTAGHDNAFGGSVLSLNGGSLNANGARVLGNDVTLDLNSTISGTQAIRFDGSFTLNGSRTLTVSNTGGTTIAGVLGETGGPANFTKAGTGALTLSNLNTFSGQAILQAGTTSIDTIGNADGTASALGAPTTAGTGTIKLGTTTNTATLLYTGAGGLSGTSNRAFELAGATGGGTITNNGSGALTLSGDVTASVAGAKILTLNGTNAGANAFSGDISNGAGTVTVTKSGAGTWKLSGNNSYTGNTNLTAGSLVIGDDNAFGTTGTLIISANTTLLGDGTTRTPTNAVRLSGNATIGGASELNFGGTLTQNNAGSYVLTLSNSAATNFADIYLSNGGTNRTLTLNTTGGDVAVTGVIANGDILNGGTSTLSGLTKNGGGTLTLSNANTYGGITTLTAGTLRVTNANALGTSVAANALALGNGVLELANDASTNFGRNVTTGTTPTIKVDRATAGAGTVIHTLGNLVTSSSTLTVQSGANVDADTAYGLTFGAVSLVGNPFTLNVANNGAGLGTVTLGSLSNAAARGLTKAGDGTLVLSAASGALTSGTAFVINNGTLKLGVDGALGASALANVTVNATTGPTATLDLTAANQSILNLTFGGTLATSSSVNTVSTGTKTLTLGAGLGTGIVTYSSTNQPLGALLAGKVDLGGFTRTFNIVDSTNILTPIELTVSADISGTSVGLTKTGTGVLLLSGNNSFNGTTTVTTGTLRATTSANALGLGSLSLGAATLQLADDTALGTGIAFNNNTTVTASTATIQSDRGVADVGTTQTLGTLSIGTSTLSVSPGANVNSGTAGLTFGVTTLTGNAIFNVGGSANLTLGAVGESGGARTLTKSGAGELTLTGTGANSGTVTLSAGTLTVNSGATLAASTAVLVVNGGTLNLDNTAQTVGRLTGSVGTIDLGSGHTLTTTQSLSSTFSGTITGAGNLVVNSANTLTLSGANTYAGTTAINNGGISINSIANADGTASALGAPTSVANGTIALGAGATTGTLFYTGTGHSTDRVIDLAGTAGGGTLSASGAGALIFTGDFTASGAGAKTLTLTGTSTGANAISGLIVDNSGANPTSVFKTSTGAWTLTGANTYSGTTAVGRGTLNFNSIGDVGGGASALGAPTTIAAGTIDLGSTNTTGILVYSGAFQSTDRVINLAGTTGGGMIDAGAGGLEFTSDLTATGVGAKTLTLSGTSTASIFSGAIVDGAGTTALTKSGTGTWTLTGSNSHSGATSINAGTLSVQNNTGLGATTATTSVANGAELELNDAAHGDLSIVTQALNLAGDGFGGTSGALHSVAGSNSLAGAITLTAATTIKTDAGSLTLSGGITSADHALTIAGAGATTLSGALALGTGSLTKSDASTLTFTGSTGIVGQVHLDAGNIAIGGSTVLNTGAIDSAVGTTLSIASGGSIVADYAAGNTDFFGTLAGPFGGANATFQKDGLGTLTFNTSFDAAKLTLVLNGGTLSLANNTQFAFDTIHITGDTVLDFNNSAGSVLSSRALIIDFGVSVTVNNWVAAANSWFATSTINGGTLPGTGVFGGTPLSQVNFTGGAYYGQVATWVSTTPGDAFDHEIRPTPEPATYGAIFLSACCGLMGWRRWRNRAAVNGARSESAL